MTAEEIELYKADKKKEDDRFNRWMWFAVLEKLADGDVTKFDEVSKQNFILCLNLLAYWKEKEKKIEEFQRELNKQQQNK